MGCCQSRSPYPYLRQSSFSHRLTPGQLRIFSKYFTFRSFNAGSTLFEAKSLGNEFYFILNGSVNLFVNGQAVCQKTANDSLSSISVGFFNELKKQINELMVI